MASNSSSSTASTSVLTQCPGFNNTTKQPCKKGPNCYVHHNLRVPVIDLATARVAASTARAAASTARVAAKAAKTVAKAAARVAIRIAANSAAASASAA